MSDDRIKNKTAPSWNPNKPMTGDQTNEFFRQCGEHMETLFAKAKVEARDEMLEELSRCLDAIGPGDGDEELDEVTLQRMEPYLKKHRRTFELLERIIRTGK